MEIWGRLEEGEGKEEMKIQYTYRKFKFFVLSESRYTLIGRRQLAIHPLQAKHALVRHKAQEATRTQLAHQTKFKILPSATC